MGTFSISHWLVVLLVFLLLFGPKKISAIGKGLGEGLRNFRAGLSEEDAPAAARSSAVGATAARPTASGDFVGHGELAVETKSEAVRDHPTPAPVANGSPDQPSTRNERRA